MSKNDAQIRFFDLLYKKYSIDVRDDWEEFKKSEQNETKNEAFHCIYEYKRNPKKGEVCGKKIKSGDYCSINKKKEKVEKGEKGEDENEENDDKLEKVKQKIEPVDQTLVVKLYPKIGKYIHPLTRLAFFSKEHKVVYGKLSSLTDTIIPLCDKDIETCKRYLFRYDTTLIK